MPPPAPLLIAAPGALAACKAVAIACVDTLTSATLAALVARWTWKKLPPWIRRDVSFRALIGTKKKNNEAHNNNNNRDEEDDDDDENKNDLSNLGAVLTKLQAMLAQTQKEALAPGPTAHAVLAYVQLTGQWKLQQQQQNSTRRDDLYAQAGPHVSSMLKDQVLQSYCRYAAWAYYEHHDEMLSTRLTDDGWTLLSTSTGLDVKQEEEKTPGTVAYYVASRGCTVDSSECSGEPPTLLIGVRGTSCLEDLVTDCCGRAVRLTTKADLAANNMRIEVSARKDAQVVNNTAADSSSFEVIRAQSERILLQQDDTEGDTYTRCHEGILISARQLVAQVEPVVAAWQRDHPTGRIRLTGHSLGGGAAILATVLLRRRHSDWNVHVYAFAPPPVLDHDAALAATLFCTSVVNNTDVIPRCNLRNLAVWMECLRAVHERLVARRMNPTAGPAATIKFIRHLRKGLDAEPILTVEELDNVLQRAQESVPLRKPEHLYVAGKVYLFYAPWSSISNDGSSCEATEIEEYQCVETDGAAAVFRSVEVDGARLFADHVTASYYAALGMEYDF